ncbi:hypothetical protein [Desulforudis sp. DRI-14]|uniref:hypothetical protein n=1 Tax=Desulforudis sp. DRI-14 TaxID=3459793 RepID=UPI0040413076
MYWQSEDSLIETFIELFKPQSTSSFVLRREFVTNYGRPDVVVIEYDEKSLDRRRSEIGTKPDKFPKELAHGMTYLSGKPWVRPETLGQFLNVSKSHLKRIIGDLDARGLVQFRGPCVKARTRTELLVVRRIWVFEAKLKNWRVALDQAYRHLWFTGDSYVLMPQTLRQDEIANECRQYGVGLSVICRNDCIKYPLRAIEKGVRNCPIVWTINEELVGGYYEPLELQSPDRSDSRSFTRSHSY